MSVERNYKPGDELVPGYKLVQFLGRGGFGQVWKAAAPGGTLCALKMILLKDKMAFKEFNAIRLVKLIRHPNLTPILALWLKDDQGNLINENADLAPLDPKGGKDFELLVAMGLGDKNLLDRLEECRDGGLAGIPIDELLNYMEASAKAIDFLNKPSATPPGGSNPGEAHKAIQHCDIKPQNILIVGGEAQVCDFGLARSADDVRKTSSGAASYCYVAPELISNQTTKSTDQYSLAISYYELRTGQLPFHAQSLPQVIQVHLQGTLDFSLIQAEEQKILKRATSLKADERWPTCLEMARALRRAIEGGSSSEGGRSSSQSGWKPTTGPLQPDTELVPDHKLVRYLGRGSYGEVWEATTGAGGAMKVALKIISGLQRQQGQQEFRALELVCQEEIAHHHLLEVKNFWLLDAGGMPIKDEIRNKPGAPTATTLVISMRLAVKSLLQRLKEFQAKPGHVGGMPLDELLPYMRQAAEAIDYLNTPQMRDDREFSIQHRDIKPENILLDRNNQVKVADFGLAKVLEGSKAAITGDSLGFTPNYAAPEYFKNEVTPWSDQYSLAVTYYHLRAGRLPFQPGTSAEIMRVHQEGRLDFAGLLPKEQDVLKAATALNPEDRYPSCTDMVGALEEACGWIAPEGPRSRGGRTTQKPPVGPSGQWGQPIDPYRQTAAGPRRPATQPDFSGMQTGQIPSFYSLHTQESPRPGSNPGMPDMGGLPNDTAVNPAALTQRPRSDPDFLAHVQQPDPRVTGSNPNLGLMQTSPLPSSHPSMHGYGPQGFAQAPYPPGPGSGYGMQGQPSLYNYGPPPKSKKMIWIGGLVLLLVIGGAFGAWKLGGGGTATNNGKPGPDGAEIKPSPSDLIATLEKKRDELKKLLSEPDLNPAKLDLPIKDLEKTLEEQSSLLSDSTHLPLKVGAWLALARGYERRRNDPEQLKYYVKKLQDEKDNLPSNQAPLKADVEAALPKLNLTIVTPTLSGGTDQDKALLEQYNKALDEAYGLLQTKPKNSGGKAADPEAAVLKFKELTKLPAKFKDVTLQRKSREATAIGLARANWMDGAINGKQDAIDGVQDALRNGAGQPVIEESKLPAHYLPENENRVKALQCLVALKQFGPGMLRLVRLMELCKASELAAPRFEDPELSSLKEYADGAKSSVLTDAINESDIERARKLTEQVIQFDGGDLMARAHIEVLEAIKNKDTAGGLASIESLVAKNGSIPRRSQLGGLLLVAALKNPNELKERVRRALGEGLPQVKDNATYVKDYRIMLGQRIELDLRTGATPRELAKSRDEMKEALRTTTSPWVKGAMVEVFLGESTGWGQAQEYFTQIDGSLKESPYGGYLHALLLAHEGAGGAGNLDDAAQDLVAAFKDPLDSILMDPSRQESAARTLVRAAAQKQRRSFAGYKDRVFEAADAATAYTWLAKASSLKVSSDLEANLLLNLSLCAVEKSPPAPPAQTLLTRIQASPQIDLKGIRLLYRTGEALKASTSEEEQQIALDCYWKLFNLANSQSKKGEGILADLEPKDTFQDFVAPSAEIADKLLKGALGKDNSFTKKAATLFVEQGIWLFDNRDEQGLSQDKQAPVRAFSRAIDFDPKAEYYARRGMASSYVTNSLDKKQWLDQIEADAKTAIEKDKDFPISYGLEAFVLARHALEDGDLDLDGRLQRLKDAVGKTKEALLRCEKSKEFSNLVPLYLQNRATLYRALALLSPKPEDKEAYHKEEDSDLEQAKKLAETLDDKIRSYKLLRDSGDKYENESKFTQALAEYTKARAKVRRPDLLAEIDRNQGRCKYRQFVIENRDDKLLVAAKTFLLRATGPNRKLASAYYWLAKVLWMMNRSSPDQEAKLILDNFTRAVELETSERDVVLYLEQGIEFALQVKNIPVARKLASVIRSKSATRFAWYEGRILELEKPQDPAAALNLYSNALTAAGSSASTSDLDIARLRYSKGRVVTENDSLWQSDPRKEDDGCLKDLDLAISSALAAMKTKNSDIQPRTMLIAASAESAVAQKKRIKDAATEDLKRACYEAAKTKFEYAFTEYEKENILSFLEYWNLIEMWRWKAEYASLLFDQLSLQTQRDMALKDAALKAANDAKGLAPKSEQKKIQELIRDLQGL